MLLLFVTPKEVKTRRGQLQASEIHIGMWRYTQRLHQPSRGPLVNILLGIPHDACLPQITSFSKEEQNSIQFYEAEVCNTKIMQGL